MNKLLAEVNIGESFQVKPGLGIGSNWFSDTGSLVTTILQNVYIVSGILLFVLLIFGGVSFILNAGSGDAKKTAQGRKAVSSALIGFIIIFASYWIIQIIQKITGVEILNSTL